MNTKKSQHSNNNQLINHKGVSMKKIKFLLLFILFFVLMSCLYNVKCKAQTQLSLNNQDSEEKIKYDTISKTDNTISILKQKVQLYDGSIEPVHLSDGIAIIITGKTSLAVTKIQEIVDSLISQISVSNTDKTNAFEIKIENGIGQKKIEQQFVKISNGFLFVYTSKDSSLVKLLQDKGDCDYCICPSYLWQCQKCCN